MEDKRKYIPNSFQTPNVYIDEYLHILSGNEYKVLSYMMRRIFGFHKNRDRISVSQISKGLVSSQTGEQLDYGTGLSKVTVISCLEKLQEYGLVIKVSENNKGNQGAAYELSIMPEEVHSKALEDHENKKNVQKDKMKEVRKHIKDDRDKGDEAVKPLDRGGKAVRPLAVKPLDTQSSSRNPVRNPDSATLGVLSRKELEKTKKPDLLDGMIHFAKSRDKLLDNLYDYPVHHQDIIKEFSRRWRIFPPPKGTTNYKKWCGDAKDVDIMLTNAELPIAAVFDEAYYVWKTPPAPWEKRENFEKFTVTDLGSTKNLLWVAISNLAAGNPARKVKIYTDAYGNPIEVEK